MSDSVLLAKLLFGGVGFVATIVLVRLQWLRKCSPLQFSTAAFALLVFSRVAAFVAVFGILGLTAQSDVAVYYKWTHAAMTGGLPSRDFPLHYGPLFTYVTAAAVRLWDSPNAIIALAIVFEAASFPFWLMAARKLFSDSVVRTATLLYVASPIVVYNVAVLGQNQIWIAAFLALSLWLMLLKKDALSGLALGASVVIVKFLSILFMPVLGIAAAHRTRWAAGFLLLPVAVTAICWWIGIDVAEPLRFHSQHVSSGNIPYLLTLAGLDLTNASALRAVNLAALLVLAIVYLIPVLHGSFRGQHTVHLITLLLLTTLLLSKKSFGTYLAVAYFPFCISIACRRFEWKQLVILGVFGLLVLVESSLWFRWLGEGDLDLLWQTPLPAEMDRRKIMAFVICELLTIAGYLYYAAGAWTLLRRPSDRSE